MPTLVSSCIAAFIGGLAPDLDEASSDAWDKVPAGSLLCKIIDPLLGGHRFISHSLVGMTLFGVIVYFLMGWVSTFILVDKYYVTIGFLIGMTSHLIADGITKEGIPLLFPLAWKFGFPPFAFLRVRTGSWVEKYLVFPLLTGMNIFLFVAYAPLYTEIIKQISRTS
jgi:membrane-bound metal-dependent hydrolase YbcI (DUF457 family)